jgi:hypothetical protein
MEERRRSIRQKCFMRGRVDFDGGRKSVDCLIRDISYYEGARIIFYDPREHSRCGRALHSGHEADFVGMRAVAPRK